MTRPLESLWDELTSKGSGPAYIRVDELHQLDLYAGVDTDGALLLMLVTESKPSLLKKRFKAFEVTCHLRQDQRWALNVRLQLPDFKRIFAHLCSDLVEASRAGCTQAQGPAFVLERIGRWERLLTRDRSGLLDEASIRGLIGELIFLERCAIPTKGPSLSIASWYGPLDSNQDFHFPDRSVEVKTTSPGSLAIMISSAEQLDVHGTRLFLSVIPLEYAQAGTADSFTLPELVTKVKELLRGNGEALTLFEDRLELVGYVEQREYDHRRFVVHGIRHYAVDEGFPRLRRSEMPEAIGMLRYELDVARCQEFERLNCFE